MLPKGDLVNQFKPVVPWPHVEGVEVDLNSIRLKHGETQTFHLSFSVCPTDVRETMTQARHLPRGAARRLFESGCMTMPR